MTATTHRGSSLTLPVLGALLCLIQLCVSKVFTNLGCPSYNFLVNEVYLAGGLNSPRSKVFRAEGFYEYPKMLFWLRVIPKPLLDPFTTGYLLRATGLFDLATIKNGDKYELGIKLAAETTYQTIHPDAADKELLILITAPINFDGTAGRLAVHVGDLTPITNITSTLPTDEELTQLKVNFKAKVLTLPQNAYSVYYDTNKAVGQRTSELRLGAGNNVCGAPPCIVGDYRGSIREFSVLPFVVLTDEDFPVSFKDKTWSLDGSRLNKEYVYYTVMSQLPGGMDCITTARSTGA